MSWQTPTHSSQMKTVGPALSLRTSFWLLLQNEHRNTSSLFFFKGAYLYQKENGLKLTSDKALSSLGNDLVDNTIFLRLVRGHDIVALDVLFDALKRLSGMVCQNFIQNSTNAKNFFRMNVDVRRLTLQSAHPRLVNENARVRQ